MIPESHAEDAVSIEEERIETNSLRADFDPTSMGCR
jgi:hypothetical protein